MSTRHQWPAHAPSFHEPEAPPRAPQPARPTIHARRPLPTRRFAGTGHAPATFGELIQGREPHTGHDFLVTLSITIGSMAQFCGFDDSSALYVFPCHKSKSLKAARLFLEAFDIRTGGILQIRSAMAEGKGLANQRRPCMYRPSPWQGRAAYFRARASRAHDALAHWQSLLPALEVQDVDADHFSIVKGEPARTLASLASASLKQGALA